LLTLLIGCFSPWLTFFFSMLVLFDLVQFGLLQFDLV
jgi:hypothetical protein